MPQPSTRSVRVEARLSPEALAVEDQQALAAALLDPPEPNDALRRAADAHRRLVISS